MKRKILYGTACFIIGAVLSSFITIKYYNFKQFAYSMALTLSATEEKDPDKAMFFLYQAARLS